MKLSNRHPFHNLQLGFGADTTMGVVMTSHNAQIVNFLKTGLVDHMGVLQTPMIGMLQIRFRHGNLRLTV